MSELSSETRLINFSNVEVNKADIELKDLGTGEDTFSFLVPNLETARKIGSDFTRLLVPDDEIQRDSVDYILTQPGLVRDLRLDSVDTSYSEERVDTGIKVQLGLKNYRGKEPYSSAFRSLVTSYFKPESA